MLRTADLAQAGAPFRAAVVSLGFGAVELRERPIVDGRPGLRFSWALTYRLATVVGASGLAVVAFSQGSQLWDIVGAVLIGSAIADVILLIAVTWFRWRHRSEL